MVSGSLPSASRIWATCTMAWTRSLVSAALRGQAQGLVRAHRHLLDAPAKKSALQSPARAAPSWRRSPAACARARMSVKSTTARSKRP